MLEIKQICGKSLPGFLFVCELPPKHLHTCKNGNYNVVKCRKCDVEKSLDISRFNVWPCVYCGFINHYSITTLTTT